MTPKWSPKSPTWLYRQDFAKFSLNHHYNDEVEKLAYQLNEEAERTERPIRRLSQKKPAADSGRHTTQATGRPISRFTVARRLHGGGLFARRPVRCVTLTPAHRRKRSQWCREHRNWRDNEWGRVLFTDESRFSLSSDSHRILIWRERESRNHPSNIIERDRYGGRGVLVSGAIMLVPFMDDNAPCHRTVAVEQLLESEDIERMDWPTGSPDLNPIEHVWDFLGRRLAARTLPPVTIRELRLALQDEWAAMPQQLIDTLILSMGRRCETCLSVREELWFQQDGATCHTARATIDLLKDTFGDHLISRFGPVNWPPRSCDLTPLDYFLWVYVKSLVYADKPQTLDHLEDNIRRVIADIRPQMLEKVIENWTSRLDYIRASRGNPMPEIIFKISENITDTDSNCKNEKNNAAPVSVASEMRSIEKTMRSY
ncbi:transposable element Tcb2 transposase [Trichonephila clavipes]|nr:transposable element Tcb2 transposase [Trichonephila clavipes]